MGRRHVGTAAQPARNAVSRGQYPVAGDTYRAGEVPRAHIHDFQAGEGERVEHPRGAVGLSDLLLENVHPPQGDPQADRHGGVSAAPDGREAAIRPAADPTVLHGLQYRPDRHGGEGSRTLCGTHERSGPGRPLGRLRLRGHRRAAGTGGVALPHRTGIRRQGVIQPHARQDRLPAQTTVPIGRGFLRYAPARDCPQHGASEPPEPADAPHLRGFGLCPRGTGGGTYLCSVRCDTGIVGRTASRECRLPEIVAFAFERGADLSVRHSRGREQGRTDDYRLHRTGHASGALRSGGMIRLLNRTAAEMLRCFIISL